MNSLKGRQVLVTGCGGFIGSHLAERLIGEGAFVRALCHYNSAHSQGWLDSLDHSVKDAIDVRLGDIRDGRFVEELCSNIQVVFHLAALIAIPYSYAAPESYVETNVLGTLNVLEAAKRRDIERVVHVSTSEVYGTPKFLPITESHPINAQSPYAASKASADQLCLAYHAAFNTPVVTVRPFNTYGPRQSVRAVLPSILLQLLAGEREIDLGNLEPRRDLTFVTDTVEALYQAGTVTDIEGLTIHLGTGRTTSIGELLATACKVLGVDASARTDQRRVRPCSSEVFVLQSDPSLAAHQLGWNASVSLEDGIKMTAGWLRDNRNRYPDDTYVL